MEAPITVHVALAGISALVALVLLIAWREFGHPRHALTWAIAFAIGAAAGARGLSARLAGFRDYPPAGSLLILAAIASALIAIGFRQRSGRRHVKWIAGSALVFAAAIPIAAWSGVSAAARPALLTIFEAVMFWMAARALTGRRRNERTAERIAAAVLLLLAAVNAATTIAIVAATSGIPISLPRLATLWTLLLPAIVTGIGLFTIFLLAADLSDRTRRLAGMDMLTGLLNRRGFEEAARAIIASMRRNQRSMALAVIDIDRFKSVNDRFGHSAGDTLIRSFATCLRDNVARRDLAARVGGEEFAVIITDVDADAAMCAAEVLRGKIEKMALDVGEPFEVTASFGVTMLQPEDESLGQLFARADSALYQSKSAGRNRTTFN